MLVSLFAIHLIRYFSAALIVHLVVLFVVRRLAGRFVIQRHRSWGLSQIRREILDSVIASIVFSISGLVISLGVQHGVLQIDTSLTMSDWWKVCLNFILLVVIQDAFFYWSHRLLHHPRLFRLIHLRHHLSRNPTAFAAIAFSIPEAIVQSLFLVLFMLVIPVDIYALGLWLVFYVFRSAVGHCGCELFPNAFIKNRFLELSTTTTHHDQHHLSGRYNYGLYFTWWDRAFRTEHPNYRTSFLRAKSEGQYVGKTI